MEICCGLDKKRTDEVHCLETERFFVSPDVRKASSGTRRSVVGIIFPNEGTGAVQECLCAIVT